MPTFRSHLAMPANKQFTSVVVAFMAISLSAQVIADDGEKAASDVQQVAFQDNNQVNVGEKQDPRIGKKVIVTVAGAALRTPEAVVWKAYLGETFTVTLTNDEWLWVSEKGGWLWEKETLPFDTAVKDLSARIEKSPSAENHLLRGIARMAHQQYNEAISDFTASLSQRPKDAGALNNRGQAHYLKKDYDNAIKDFDAAIKADPQHFVAMNNRALCRIAKEQFKRATSDLNAAIKINKEYPEALNNRGVVNSRRGQFEQAIADFTAALKIDESYAEAYANRSAAYRKRGLLNKATADLKLSMKKNPLDHRPVNDLAWIYATAEESDFHKPKEAVAMATRACQMTHYSDWNALETLAAACAAAGDVKNAQQWIATALEKAPADEKAGVAARQKLIAANEPIPAE